MASTRDIRRRIRSVKNTSQITRAMQMVAASKMRKAQQAALNGRPYATLMNEVLGEVTFLAGVVVVSTDKGLCGALNSNLLREATKYDKQTTTFITAGRKASQFIARTKRHLAAEFTYKDAPLFSEARAISKFARELFVNGEVDQVVRARAPVVVRPEKRGRPGHERDVEDGDLAACARVLPFIIENDCVVIQQRLATVD